MRDPHTLLVFFLLFSPIDSAVASPSCDYLSMRRLSEVVSCIKNIADRLKALLTITQVLTFSTEDANNSSRSSNTGAVSDGPIRGGSGRPGGRLRASSIQPPVDSLAASGVSLATTANIDMESQESARTSEDERHFKRKVLLASASAVMGLASGVPFMLLSIDSERGKSSLTTQLLVSSCAIVLAILFCCMVMMYLLLYWGVRCLPTAGYICIIAGFLVFLLEVIGILLVLQTVYALK